MAGVSNLTAAQLASGYSRGELSPVDVTRALLERIDAWEPSINAMYRVHRDAALDAGARGRSAAGAPATRSARSTAYRSRSRRTSPRAAIRRRSARARTTTRRRRPTTRRPRRACAKRARDPRQDHHARLRHAVVGPVEPARHHAQSLAPRPQYVRLELRRGRGGRRRLRPAAHRHRHRRLGPAAGDALRHLRAQALARPRADRSALHGARGRADDAHRGGRGAAHERARAAGCARLHVPAAEARDCAAGSTSSSRRAAHRLAADMGVGLAVEPRGARRGGSRRGGARRRGRAGRADRAVPHRGDARRRVPLLRGALVQRLDAAAPERKRARCCPSSPSGAPGAPRASAGATSCRLQPGDGDARGGGRGAPRRTISSCRRPRRSCLRGGAAAPGNDPRNALPHIAFTVPYNMSEQPAASINWCYSADGLPIGVQIVGRRFDDAGVLRSRRLIEKLRPPQRPGPSPHKLAGWSDRASHRTRNSAPR